MRAQSQALGAHELVGWESRVWAQVACLLAVCGCSLPLLLDLGVELAPPLDRFNAWLRSRTARETTGFVGLGIIAFQVSLATVKRLARGEGAALHWWRTLHQLLPIALLVVALLHTRGKAAGQLDRWLITVLVLQIYLVQAGHLAKAFLAENAGSRWLAMLDRAANRDDGVVHQLGLRLHVLLAVVVVFLLAAHVVAVYYF